MVLMALATDFPSLTPHSFDKALYTRREMIGCVFHDGQGLSCTVNLHGTFPRSLPNSWGAQVQPISATASSLDVGLGLGGLGI